MATKPAKGQQTQEQIVAGFQELRTRQRQLAGKISELEMERKEHDLVIDALKEVEDPDRKCFRLSGGVLVERTVKEVLPALINNHEQLGKVLENLTKQLETKGKEINEYREKHNIRIKGEDEGTPSAAQEDNKSTSSGSSGVLVAQDST